MNDLLVKHLMLNEPQALVHLINANKTYCAWGRGTGKTSGVLGPRFVHLSEVMPRCQIGFITDTYERFHGAITKGIEGFITNDMGLVEGLDFLMFKKPPAHWTKPLYPIRKYDHVISFATGVAIVGGSMKIEGSLNGENLQALIGDEMKFVKQARLTEAKRAVRGARKQFGHLPEYRSEWYTTDKYGEEIWWYLDKKKEMKPQKVATVLKLSLRVQELIGLMEEARDDKNLFYRYRKEKMKLEALLNGWIDNNGKLHPGLRNALVNFSEAALIENIQIIGQEAYDDLVNECASDNERSVALENKDPDKAESQFYPSLSEENKYEISCDYDPNLPLIIILDYQFRLTPIVVCQVGKLPGSEQVTLNFIDNIDSEVGINDALQKFHERYNHHPYREVKYLYDHTAKGRKPDGVPFYEGVLKYMNDLHWNITGIDMGQAPDHAAKHENTKNYLNSDGSETMAIRINKATCNYMILSMQLAGAVIKKGVTQKDKTSETKLSIPARLSTHYSDCFDQAVRAIIELKLVQSMENYLGILIRG